MKKKLTASIILLLTAIQLHAQHKPTTRSVTGPPTSLAMSVANGKKVYIQYCLSCHQADGGGVPNMNPPLINTSYVKGDKVRLIKVVLNGFTESVDIDGESYSNNMAPHNFLKDQEIADVLTYVRNAFGNKGTAIKASEVKTVRAAKKK